MIIALALGFSATPARATNPPVKAWQWTAPYNNNLAPFNNANNWSFNVLSVADGGHVSVGFTFDNVFNIYPTAQKVDASGRELWNRAYTQSQSSPAHSQGRAFDVVEVTDGYVIVFEAYPQASQAVGIVKVDKNTGLALTGFPKWIERSNLAGYPLNEQPEGHTIEVVQSAGVAQGYIIGGASQVTPYAGYEGSMRGCFLMRLDLNFNLVTAFGTGGWTIKNRAFNGNVPAVEKSGIFDVKVLYDNNNPATGLPTGIIATGSAINGASGATDRDVIMLATDMNGATTFIKTYSENQPASSDYALVNFGYVDVGSPEFTLCTSGTTEATNHERGSSVLQYSTTEAVALSVFDLYVLFSAGGWNCHTNPGVQAEGYLDNDMALFRINLATGAPQNNAPAPKNVARYTGIDYQPRALMDATSIYVIGQDGTLPFAGSSTFDMVGNDVVKVGRTDFVQNWRYKPIAPVNIVNCTFGACLTQDGGMVLSGNNELENEDYFILKLTNDCGTNETYTGPNDLYNGVTYTSTPPAWNTSRKVRGIVRIKPGVTLTINSTAVISFADSRSYNNYEWLAGNNFNTIARPFDTAPTKIVVEKGGTLVLGGTAKLTGLSTGCAGATGMWEGIEILGDPGLVQLGNYPTSDPNQGRMITSTGITIEKMFGAAVCDWNNYDVAGQIEHSGPNWTNKGGGYIQMTNGTIQNSRNDVYMAPYFWVAGGVEVDNKTKFTGTVFQQTAHLGDITFVDAFGNRVGTDKFFQAVSCNKVVFTDTKFKGFPTLLRRYRGQGIRGNDSEIDMTTTQATPAFNFEDLTVGVFGVGALRRVSVTNSRFNSNLLGILEYGGQGAFFNNNTINVPLGTNGTTDFTSGIRLDGHSYAQVTNNTITGMGTGVFTDFNRGFVAHNCGTNTNFVGYNTFDKLRIAEQSQGVNGTSGTSTQGLTLQCNTHGASNYLDIAVNKAGGFGVMPQQGQGCPNPQTQAGNTFLDQTGCGSPAAENIISPLVNFTYYGVASTTQFPNCVSTTVNNVGCNPGNSANCPGTNLVCATAACNQANITAMNAETDAQKKEILRNRIIAYYLQVDTPTVAITLLTAWNNASSKRRIVPMYLRLKQWANAQTALNVIGSGNTEDAAYTTVYQTLIDIGTTGGTLLTFTPAQKSALDIVAKGSTSISSTAQGLLNIADGRPITLVWVEPDESGSGSSQVKMLEAAAFGDLVAMPNPFDASTTIQCALTEGAMDVRLLLTDLEGRVLEDRRVQGGRAQLLETISGDGRPNGMYLCTVTADGAVLGVTRIVVQH